MRTLMKLIVAVGALAAARSMFLRYRRWHLRWGATEDEVARPMPGDELVSEPHFAATRAITVSARPDVVWPWLAQLGYGRAGWYSYDLLDNLGHGASAERIVPELQELHVGDLIPMGPIVNEETAWRVEAIDPPRSMVWAKPASTWAWTLEDLPDGSTRLVTRIRLRHRWRLALVPEVVLMELGDFPMMRKELLSIRERAERQAATALSVGKG